jgi:gas vesicle protein
MTHTHGGKKVKRLLIGGGIAAAAGYLVGVLSAPKSGKETRDSLSSRANKGLLAGEKDLKRLHTELGKTLTDTKKSSGKLSKKAQQELEEAVVKAKDTKEKVREIISAVHEGTADDKELQNAIDDAKATIGHLKTYFSKK